MVSFESKGVATDFLTALHHTLSTVERHAPTYIGLEGILAARDRPGRQSPTPGRQSRGLPVRTVPLTAHAGDKGEDQYWCWSTGGVVNGWCGQRLEHHIVALLCTHLCTHLMYTPINTHINKRKAAH